MKNVLKNVLSIKSILFYSITIVSVVALFSLTTAYGETYLKAATPIAGRYRFLDSDCFKGMTLRLDQSGRYLTATIGLTDRTVVTPPTLSATWSGFMTAQGSTPLTLHGRMPSLSSCYPAQQVWFQGTLDKTLDKQFFSGQLILADGTRVPFRSQLEPKSNQKTDRSH
jgi:hypothetical protein